MNQRNQLQNLLNQLVLPAVVFGILAIMSDHLSTLFFGGNAKEEMNPLGKFFTSIDERVAWILFVVGCCWTVETFLGKKLQLRSPFFYLGTTYLIFYVWGNIYKSTPLYCLSVILIIPLVTKYIKTLFRKGTKASSDDSQLWEYDYIKKGSSTELYHGREEIIDMICSEISKMSNGEHSFTIGLEGGWGSGKSTLFKHIKDNLPKCDNNGLTIEYLDFSPWAFPEGKNLSIEYLYELRKMLSKYSFRARFVINSYINVLASSYSLGLTRLISALLFPRESLTCVKDKLNKLLLFHKVKMVVFIDDLDRLDKDEISEVFKMLRNTGDIANTIYLVAYDRVNVERFDEFCKGFLDKIINVEIDLTPYDSSILLEKFTDDVKDDFKEPLFNVKSGFDNILELQRNPYIIRDICNPRDIKRLKNSIRARLCLIDKINQDRPKSVEENASMLDLFDKNFLLYLEIVKLKDYRLYLAIKNQSIYEDDFSNKISKEFDGLANRDDEGKIEVKYKNRYSDKLLDYLVEPSEDTASDVKVVYIPRIRLDGYFATNFDELYVSTFIRSFIDKECIYDNDVIEQLGSWIDKENLFARSIFQIKLTFEEAKRKNASSNFCAFVASLVFFDKYYYALYDLISHFCNDFGSVEMFEFINVKRRTDGPGRNFEKETSYDKLYNRLVHENYSKPSKKIWYSTIIESQEERLRQLADAQKMVRARGVLCWINQEDGDIPVLSDGAIKILRRVANEEPEIFFTEWAFYKLESSGTIPSNKSISSLFKDAHELYSFVEISSLSSSNPELHQSLLAFIKGWDHYPHKNIYYKPRLPKKNQHFVDAVKSI